MPFSRVLNKACIWQSSGYTPYFIDLGNGVGCVLTQDVPDTHADEGGKIAPHRNDVAWEKEGSYEKG